MLSCSEVLPPQEHLYLADDEEVLTLHSLLFDLLLDGFSHLILILIDIGTVNVTIPCINGCLNCFFDLAWRRLRSKRRDHWTLVSHPNSLHMAKFLQTKVSVEPCFP